MIRCKIKTKERKSGVKRGAVTVQWKISISLISDANSVQLTFNFSCRDQLKLIHLHFQT